MTVTAPTEVTGYHCDAFGQTWSDHVVVTDGHNGCDTRIICTLAQGYA